MATPTSALDNILESVKSGIGIQPADTTFDGPITNHINSVLMILNQVSVGVAVRVAEDGAALWSEFLPDGDDDVLSLARSYTILKVQSLFDPPTSGIVTGAAKEVMDESLSRLLYMVEGTEPVV